MRCWYFTEQSYHPAWHATSGHLRFEIATDLIDPPTAHQLLNRYMDEYMLADELGLGLMVNEHHASVTCMSVACMVTMGILARQTRKARLLVLGIPITNRADPFRIAEEIAYVDAMSGGRLELGLIKGTPNELTISNMTPARMNDRFWEAHTLIRKALSHTSGPFSWEGTHFQYRTVNVVPRCVQQPLPPIWMPVSSGSSARQAARLDFTVACITNGFAAKGPFDAMRDEYAKAHGRPAPAGKLAYIGMVALGRDAATARARAVKVAEHALVAERQPAGSQFPPGVLGTAEYAQVLRLGGFSFYRAGGRMDQPLPSIDDLRERGLLFFGTPDAVFEQIRSFNARVGGFGNFLVQMGGMLDAEESFDSIRLLGTELAPRLAELG